MLNGNSSLVPSQPSVLALEDVFAKGKARQLKEPLEDVVEGGVAFDGSAILLHVPQYQWRLEVQIIEQDEEAH